MEWTKTCGPIPGGFILTQTHLSDVRSTGAPQAVVHPNAPQAPETPRLARGRA